MENSVTLDKHKCQGCTTCMKHCPTEAIRVRRGRAQIIKERCIDCGNCIRVCPYKAKKAVTDPFSDLERFEYTVALPAPSLYSQFNNLSDVEIVLAALKHIGFSDVYEVASAAEVISDLTRKAITKGELPHPLISSACPAAVRLVQMRFPGLIPSISKLLEPVELAAIEARKRAVERTGLPPEKIGIFFITPCPAKVTTAREHTGFERRIIDGAVSMTEVYKKLLTAMKQSETGGQLSESGIVGIGWSRSGGETAALLDDRGHLAVDGIDNIIEILEDIEAGMLPEISFLELNACTQGCVGGCLAAANAYVAKGRVGRLMRYLPVSRSKANEDSERTATIDKEYEPLEIYQLDGDKRAAMDKFDKIRELEKKLPGLDCGSCGAPSCRALAEDIILGGASEEDCIFRMRERVAYMTGSEAAEAYLPPPFRKDN